MAEETEISGYPARIRILQVIQSLHIGGAEMVVAHLATGLNQSAFDVQVICTRETGQIGKRIRGAGIPVSIANQSRGWSRYLAPLHLLRCIRQFRPHVIHSHGMGALSAMGSLASLGFRYDWIHTFHFGNYPHKNKRRMRMEAFFARRVPRLVAVADSQRQAILTHHRVSPGRIVVVPNGVQANPFLSDPGTRRKKREELGLTESDFVAGSICVLSEQKGIAYLLDAAVRVLRRQPDVKFVLVGGGPLESSLRARASQLGLGASVVFTGWRSDVQELLTAFDVYVMSSLWEAMPLALLEAMAAGRALVVTDVGDNAAFTGNGECAILVRPRDPLALEQAITNLAHDRESVAALGNQALRRFQSKYTVSHMIQAYERLYRRG